jgi:hypothetical protein
MPSIDHQEVIDLTEYEVIDLTDVTEEETVSGREFSWRQNPNRVLLEFSATKAPMNPEELTMQQNGIRVMKQAKIEASSYPTQKIPARRLAPQNNDIKKKSFFSFRKPRRNLVPKSRE